MGAIRAGGLASGLDTNAIIEELVSAAKEPIVRLNNSLYLKNLEKSLYKDINSQLTGLKSSLFNLRMEATFKSKVSISSSTSVAGVKVTSDAAVGSHLVEVLQTAKNASMSSRFTTARISANNIGAKGVSGLPYVYDQQEGVHRTQVFEDSGKSYATTVFVPDNNKSYTKYGTGQSISTAFADEFGSLVSLPITDTIQFSIQVDGVTQNLSPITIDTTNPNDAAYGITDLNSLMLVLENKLNDQLNAHFSTSAVQYAAMRADYSAGEWSAAIYNVGDINIGFGVVDGGGTLDDSLALNGTIAKSTTAVIMKYHAAASLSDLQGQLENSRSSIVPGVALTFNTTLTYGGLELIQNASMNVSKATRTSILGSTAGTAINTAKAMNSGNTGLAYANLSAIVGTFTINDTKITIDSADRTMDEIMAIVNSSGAGVTMWFDNTTQQFALSSNKEGQSSITLGGAGDTSEFLQIFKLSKAVGAVEIPGTTSGKISTTSPINQAGFTLGMTSGIFTFNGVPIFIDVAKDSVEDLMRKVNSSAADVTLQYDSTRDKFVITSNNAGQIVFGGGDTSNALEIMGLTYDRSQMLALGEAGRGAVINVDGQTFTRSSNVIDDVLTGVTFTVNSVGTTIIDISADTDKAVDALASFIKGYNTLMKTLLPGEISKDDRNKKMTALTEEDKKSMSDDEVASYMKEYDALHTQDLILKSRELKNLAKGLRGNTLGVLMETDSTFKSLSQLGFSVAGAAVGGGDTDVTLVKYGFLMVDSIDLDDIKESLKSNSQIMENLTGKSDDVYLFFAQNKDVDVLGAAGTSKTIQYRGWARNYDTMVSNFQAFDGAIGVKTRVDSALEKQIQALNKNIATKTQRAEDYLERLWKQFTAMETRVAAIQSQSQYLSQLTANISGSSQ